MNIRKTRWLIFMTMIAGIITMAGCQGVVSENGDDTGNGDSGNGVSEENGETDLGPGSDGGPAAVNLNSAGNYVILAKSAITTTGTTAITGDLGISPESLSDTEGFSPTLDIDGTFATSSYVTGKIYAAGMTEPTPTELTAAIGDMQSAYTTVAGLSDPDVNNLGSGEIGGLTIEPGLYKWGTGVAISTDVTLHGSSTATWIFQIAEDLTVANGVQVTLAGGALAENIVWQVGTNAAIGTTAAFAGTLMTGSDISLNTGASVNGRLFAQTAVTLDANAVTQP
ncbi:ice-binding family protein [Spirochaeta dissipatitropha]